MIVCLLLVQLAMCSSILWRELVVNKFSRIASSIFFSVYLLLYIIEPLVIHVFFGGPHSIVRESTAVIGDDYVFVVYNLLGITLLATAWIFSRTTLPGEAEPPAPQLAAHLIGAKNLLGLCVPAGAWVFYKSTGLSMEELLVASRFAWVDSGAYNPVVAVAAAYLIAISPVYFMLYFQSPRRSWGDVFVLMLVLAGLLLYGAVTKDRKWIFYVVSGWVASTYLRGGRAIRISPRGVALLVCIGLVVLASQMLRDIIPRLLLDGEIGDQFSESMAKLFVESDLSYFYSATIEAIHQHVNHGFSVTLGLARRVLFLFVPTSVSFGLKVEDMAATFSDVVGGGDAVRRGNMPPGLFGLFVVSFGTLGAAMLMPLLAWALRTLDRMLRRPLNLFALNALCFLPVAVMFFFRGDESTVFYFPAINMLMTGSAALIYRFFRGTSWRK